MYTCIFLKFRTTYHHLPVENGGPTHLCERLCTLCNDLQISDEFHYIIECKALIDIRKDNLGKYYTQKPNVKSCQLKKKKMLKNSVCLF